jgi:hypothetical protein
LIGFRPGDPTVGTLPPTLPPLQQPPSADVEVIDLAELTQTQICQLAAESAPEVDVFAALLPEAPGAPPHRLATFSNQHKREVKSSAQATRKLHKQPRVSAKEARSPPKKRKCSKRALAPHAIVEALTPYFDEHGALNGQEIPWSVVGWPRRRVFSRGEGGGGEQERTAPVIAGNPVRLRALWEGVQSHGGYSKASTSKLWSSIARRVLSLRDARLSSNCGFHLKTLYTQHLLPWEVHCFGSGGEVVGEGYAAGQDEDQGDGGVGPQGSDEEEDDDVEDAAETVDMIGNGEDLRGGP